MLKVKNVKKTMVIAMVVMLLMIMQSAVLATNGTIVITGNNTTGTGVQPIPTLNSTTGTGTGTTGGTTGGTSGVQQIPVTNNNNTNSESKVTVTITANKEVQALGNGWTLSSDKKVLTKTYTANTTETVTLTDTAGNKGDAMQIKVDMSLTNGGTNVDYTLGNSNSTKPLASVKYTKTLNEASKDNLPKTGIDYSALFVMVVCVVSGVYAYIKIRDYNQIQY